MPIEISDNDFQSLKNFLYNKTGVFLQDTKKSLVIARLRSRLQQLKLTNFSHYIPLLKSGDKNELEFFINALTTNETFFFRNIKQFHYLKETIFPQFIEQRKNSPNKKMRIWSAACSSGEEPFSLLIFCKEIAKKHARFSYEIIASDVNSNVLQKAKKGIFPERSLKEIPVTLKNKYFSISQNMKRGNLNFFAINDSLIKEIKFIQHNLLTDSPLKNIDIIFLRNVMIYFDAKSKQKVMDNILNSLTPEGYFFISLSETLNDIKAELTSVFPGVYKKV